MENDNILPAEIYPDIAPMPLEETLSEQPVALPMTEVGRSGTLAPSGYITNEDYNSVWDTRQRFDIVEEMRRSDATVKASLSAINLPIIAAEWDIPPLSDDPIDIEIADFCKHNLMERISFFDFLRQALTMLPFGFSWFEKVFEVIEWNGKKYVGIKKLAFRKQWTVLKWETPSGRLGITQMLKSGPANLPLPWWKIIVFTNEREGDNYYGISILRGAYKHFDFKKKLYLIDAMAIERQGLGIPKLTTPSTASTQDKARAREIARNLRANEGQYVEFPEGFDLEFIDMHASTIKDAMPSIQHHNKEILLNVLAQFLDLGSNSKGGSSGGSKALSQDHSAMFQLSLEAIARNISETIYSTILTDLVTLNFPGRKVPELVFGKFSDDNVEVLATAVNQLTQVGMLTPDPTFEAWIRKTIKAPNLPDDLKDKLEEDMTNIDKTTDVKNDNSGEIEKKAKAPKKKEETDKTEIVKPDQTKKPVQADEAMEDLKTFRKLLDGRIKAIENLV